ncbi:hypothetical protein [Pseudomonas sp. NA-150]|uniref:hypothetical protein n=1 Tax=Pseudomonas sp. NA-150 TaxID=3367525 RepID=UPI0037CBB373
MRDDTDTAGSEAAKVKCRNVPSSIHRGAQKRQTNNRAGTIMDRLKWLQDSEHELERQLQLLTLLGSNAADIKEQDVEIRLKALMKGYRMTLADILKLLEAPVPGRCHNGDSHR